MKVLSGLAPTGFISTAPIKETVRWLAPHGWVDHPNCWIVACDYASGERTVFGRAGPRRMYVDGRLHSMSNLGPLDGLGLDLVIVLNPMSGRVRGQRGWHPWHHFTEATRDACARQLEAEVAALRAHATQVVVLEPGERDLRAIRSNLMDERRRQRVMRTAVNTMALALQRGDVRHQLEALVHRGAPAMAAG